ncbi:hypothetical protein KM043_006234 [Ampulex compressa]|nr:hypothetical protein KM043_006234 [Ampulex compressa]
MMVKKSEKRQNNDFQELHAWIDTIPFSKTTKNLTKDFSDALLVAEVLKVYYPRYVDLHNYASISSVGGKRENWNILNRKVLAKIDMKLDRETIDQLANSQPGAAEKLLLDLRSKILGETSNDRDQLCAADESNLDESGKEEEQKLEGTGNSEVRSGSSCANQISAGTNGEQLSTFTCIKRRAVLAIRWLIDWICIWNYIGNSRLVLQNLFSYKRKELIEVSAVRPDDSVEDENVPRVVCTQLRQELREKDDIIRTLNHKVAYLESAMRLKDLRISNLTSQILKNAVEMEQNSKSQSKSRPRSQTAHEPKSH